VVGENKEGEGEGDMTRPCWQLRGSFGGSNQSGQCSVITPKATEDKWQNTASYWAVRGLVDLRGEKGYTTRPPEK
jgi:hypothetical protein